MKATLLHEWRHRVTGARVALLSYGHRSAGYLDGYLLQVNRPTILGEDCWETLHKTTDPGAHSSRGRLGHVLELIDGRGVTVTERAPMTDADVRLRAVFAHDKESYRLVRLLGGVMDEDGGSDLVDHVHYHLQHDERDECDRPRWRTTLETSCPAASIDRPPTGRVIGMPMEFLACSLLDGVVWEIVEHRVSSPDTGEAGWTNAGDDGGRRSR